MLREDCRIGMTVVFGNGNGEQTRGVIEKMNRVKAKVRTVEARGRTGAGTVWSVPYGLMVATDGNGVAAPAPRVEQPIKYNIFQPHVDQLILEAICGVYSALSPENLTCDGELPYTAVRQRRTQLTNRLNYLFKAYGREVSESVAFAWLDEKIKSRQNELAQS